MTTTTRRLQNGLKRRLTQAMMLAMALIAPACESIYDDEGDCDPRYFVRFVYDMNMLRADAFYTQVSSVDLYVFDAESGDYVTRFAACGDPLSQPGFLLPVDLQPGHYDLVAWCGLTDGEGASYDDFTLATDLASIDDLTCTMARSRDSVAYSDANLHALYHGALSVALPDSAGDHVVTVRLTKNTNNINLSLQHTAGPLDPDRFVVVMHDDNGLMAHDNALLPDETITYRPWSRRGGLLDVETATPQALRASSRADGDSDTTADGEEAQPAFLVAELSTARLMADHNATIAIRDRETGAIIFSIPLVQWALQLRSANYASMAPQEYLDREDEYNLMVFLADNNQGGWLAVTIIINGWHIIDNDIEL